MSVRGKVLLILAIAVAVTLLDQAAKVAARGYLAGKSPIPLVGGLAQLRYTENPGALLSLGSGLSARGRTGLFVVAVVAVLALLLVAVVARADASAGEVWAVALVAAGGLGNLVDRIVLGYVRDFVVLGFGRVNTGIFNVADASITAGAIVLAISLIVSRRRGASRRGHRA